MLLFFKKGNFMNKYFRYLGALLLSLIVVFSAFGCANKGVKAIFIVDGAEYAIVTAASRDEFVMPVSPSKEGATFAGWYLTENGGGGIFSLDSLVAGGDVYVFAKWNMEHVHTAGEVKIHKAPTCFDDGISVIECSTCGHTMSTGFIDKLSHEPSEWLVVESPSCSSEGQKQRTCNLCEAVLETAAIPKAQHTAGAESIKIPSGCETVGLAVTKCTICEEVIAERELDALGHTAGEETVITPDECEAMIVAITECTVCKEVISEIELGILGHIPGEETVKTAAGCLIAGVAVL